jgi:transposase
MGEAVDKVRKQKHKELMEQDIKWLNGTKYLWLYNQENMPKKRWQEFKTLQKLDLKVSRGWALKENLRSFWNYSRMGWPLKFFKRWYFWATHSRLCSIIKAAKTIKRHIDNILIYLKHRITSAFSEALNV